MGWLCFGFFGLMLLFGVITGTMGSLWQKSIKEKAKTLAFTEIERLQNLNAGSLGMNTKQNEYLAALITAKYVDFIIYMGNERLDQEYVEELLEWIVDGTETTLPIHKATSFLSK